MTAPKVHNKPHKTAPHDAVYIGRGSPWGNPYKIGEFYRELGGVANREQVIALFEHFVLPTLDVSSLKGKHWVCFCKPHACHGDLLLKKANK